MKYFLKIIIGVLFFESTALVNAQQVPVVTFSQLQKILSHSSDTLCVYNFFATWCDPCREEFPALLQWDSMHAGKKVKLIFVSLDFKKDLSSKVIPFLKKHSVHDDAYLLDAPDYNAWIDKIDSAWDGNLPMTLVINNSTHLRRTFPHEFSAEQLQQTLTPFIP